MRTITCRRSQRCAKRAEDKPFITPDLDGAEYGVLSAAQLCGTVS
jgi:hypothetical protein